MKKFSLMEARNVLDEYNYIISSMNRAVSLPQVYEKQIKNAVDNVKEYELRKILNAISVEELNANKEGFKIKTLNDNGIYTMLDLYQKSVEEIALVKGISSEAAMNMKGKVSEYVQKAISGIKLRINADDKNSATTELVKAITIYIQIQSYSDECRNLLKFENKNIEYALQELENTKSIFKYLMSSRKIKNATVSAYNYLGNQLESDYGYNVKQVLVDISKKEQIADNTAWDEFEKNPVVYFTIIEKLIPGLSRQGDFIYGLSQELAEEVDKEVFGLNGLKCALRRYQEWGVKYILHQKNVLLGDEMGLGKTIQAIATMVALRNAGEKHFLVVCPASVLSNWCKEIKKFSDLRYTDVYGSDKIDELQEWIEYGGVAVTTFETASCFRLREDFRFSLLVVDEAHYIKNPNAKRTQYVELLSMHAERRLFMTGTALENKVDEMVSIIKMLNPSVALKIKRLSFLSRADQFREAIETVYYRRKREDVLTELPELIENEEWCRMTSYEESVYEEAVLGQNFNDARRVSFNVDEIKYSSKAMRLAEIVEEAALDGRKIIVFSYFLDTIDKVVRLLGDKCMEPINGSVSPNRRQQIVDDFNNAEAGKVLVSQIQSGGTGLNIQAASVVVICEPQLKPSIENQAISRAYRLGQSRNVLVYRLLCEDSVDEKITSMLENKQAIFDAFADKSEAAEKTKEIMEMEIDNDCFSDIINEEIKRINIKRNITA